MPGDDNALPAFLRDLKQAAKLQIPIAVNAGIRRLPLPVAAHEPVHDLLPELHGQVRNNVRDIQREGDLRRVIDILL